ncbi:MAG TPA: adenylate/guanylate cyclase domain-containing protein [Gaiellaceae bacterium]|nr:adenylate/guanylate cyclase domain-containing protein [Gaiellaceae bacterium]
MPICTSCGQDSPEGFAFCPHCGAPFAEASAGREQRKVVTVLFCDVTGSTELGERLDAEALRLLLARYFGRMKAIVERHGGTVEKFIGDAVMAVFGVPVLHEDDALRALRAAVEMRDAFPELGIQGRIGVTTGEVVTGTEERLVTGDAVNVAARLEQAAAPGEILIGEETHRLARDAIEAEGVEPLELKGKADRVPAYRLRSVQGAEAEVRRFAAAMVGRGDELQALAAAWERVVAERTCHLFTVVGAAGVGKSRLVAEFLASLDGALVVRGRCLPYGEGITYWPVVEVVKELPPAELDPVAAQTIQAVVGERSTVTSSEEIAWAFRKLLESVAADTPLVCVFDDLQWGEETFLDLVDHVALLSQDAPILLLCMARPELLDRRPGWSAGKANAAAVLLEPLGADETELLIESLADVDEALRERIREAAEGNPLFVEQMVAMARESGGGDVVVPPTIQALLAARLDQLDPTERNVLQRGAVEGRVFHRGAVQALAPNEPQTVSQLTALVRKEFVRPDRAQLPGEDAFRFRHLLVRDAAYGALPKAARAGLHDRFAGWLAEHGAGLVELDEILGYHLEQAARYRAELGTPEPELGVRASAHLAAAGRGAQQRGDVKAAANLLERALDLRSGAPQDLLLELDLADSLFLSGRPADAEALLGEAAARAEAGGDARAALLARVVRGQLGFQIDPGGKGADLRALAQEALPVFEEAGDERGQMSAWSAIGHVEHVACRFEARNTAFQRALDAARRLGDERSVQTLIGAIGPGYVFGEAPVADGLRWCAALDPEQAARPAQLGVRACLDAMEGRFDDARRLLAEMRTRYEDLGQSVRTILQRWYSAYVETRAADLDAAERSLRESCELLERMGNPGWLSTYAANLGHVLCSLGRWDEAGEWGGKSRELGGSDDIVTQMLWRQVLARVHAERGEDGEAERLAREAVGYGDRTDMLVNRANAHLDLAEVLEAAGRGPDAAGEAQTALDLFERKGDRSMADQARARLERLL